MVPKSIMRLMNSSKNKLNSKKAIQYKLISNATGVFHWKKKKKGKKNKHKEEYNIDNKTNATLTN